MDPVERKALAKMARKRGGRSAVTRATPARSGGSPRSMISRSESPRGVNTGDVSTVATLLSMLEGGEEEGAVPPDAGFEVTGIWSPESSPRGDRPLPVVVQRPAEAEEPSAPSVDLVVLRDAAGAPFRPISGAVEAEAAEAEAAAGASLPAQEGLSGGHAVPQEAATGRAAPGQEPFERMVEFLEGLLPVAEWQRGLGESEAKAAAVALLSQTSHHLSRSVEAAQRLAAAEALVGQLQEELRREREGRAEVMVQLMHYQGALREAQETLQRRDAAVAAICHDMGELQQMMTRSEEAEAALRQASAGVPPQPSLSSERTPAAAKRKAVDTEPSREEGPAAGAGHRPHKASRGGEKSSLYHHLRAAQKGVEALEQRLNDEIGTSSALRRQLEGERSRSAVAEGRGAGMERSLRQFAAGLEPALTEAALSTAAAAERQGESGVEVGAAGPAEAKRARKGAGSAG